MTDTATSSFANAANATHTANNQLGQLLVPLLKGVLYQEGDAPLWNKLLLLQAQVVDYCSVLGLELVLDEAEGYAFLRTKAQPEDAEKFPRLMARRALSFPVSLLLALLRKKLAEFDASGGELRLILPREQIVELMRVFLPENNNDARLMDQIDSHLSKVEDLGFVRKLKGANNKAQAVYEVRRILKAYVDAQWLGDFATRLAQYQQQLAGVESNEDE